MTWQGYYELCGGGVSLTAPSEGSPLAAVLSDMLEPFRVPERPSLMLLEVTEARPSGVEGFRAGRVLSAPSSIGADTGRFSYRFSLEGEVAALSLHAHPPGRVVSPRAVAR